MQNTILRPFFRDSKDFLLEITHIRHKATWIFLKYHYAKSYRPCEAYFLTKRKLQNFDAEKSDLKGDYFI